MEEISWERTADGLPARLYPFKPPLIPVLPFMHLGEAKMTGINIISGDFQGEQRVFLLQASVYLEIGTHTEFLATYVPDDEEPEDGKKDEELEKNKEKAMPAICIKRATWEMRKDIHAFAHSTSMRMYARGKGLLDSRILFLSASQAGPFFSLVKEVDALLEQGIALPTIERDEEHLCFLEFQRTGGFINTKLSYSQYHHKNEVFEDWINRWKRAVTGIRESDTMLPDHGCVISYSFPLLEDIERIPAEDMESYRKSHPLRRKKQAE